MLANVGGCSDRVCYPKVRNSC